MNTLHTTSLLHEPLPKLASDYAPRFAAVVPASGRTQLKYVAPLHNTPIWAFHGADDPVVPLSESQKLIDALQKSGGNARLTILPNTGHDAWRQAYTDPKLYEWLLEQSLKGGRRDNDAKRERLR